MCIRDRYTGVVKILSFSAEGIEIPGRLALAAAVISIIVKEWMYWYTRRGAERINSGALMADAWHHRSDSLSSAGAFLGILGARLGYPVLDVYKRQTSMPDSRCGKKFWIRRCR